MKYNSFVTLLRLVKQTSPFPEGIPTYIHYNAGAG